MTESEASSKESKQSKEYEVEEIVSDRIRKKYERKKKKYIFYKEYLIKWVGYKRRSWEPEENLDNCLEILNEYKKRKGQSKKEYKGNNINTKNTKSRTPIKGVNYMANNVNNSNNNKNRNKNNQNAKTKEIKDKTKEDKDKERQSNIKTFYNNNFVNNFINNNNNISRHYLSEEEEDDKYPPVDTYNSLFYPKFINKSENGSLTSDNSVMKKSATNKKRNIQNINEDDLANDYEIDIENDLGVNNINNNINNINNNNENINNNNYDENMNMIKKLLRENQEEIGKSLENELEKDNNTLRINLLQKKRKPDQSDISDNSDLSISIINDPFINMQMETMSFNNTNDNSNSITSNNNYLISNNTNNNETIQIMEVRIPDNEDGPMTLVCKNKEKDYVFLSSSKNTYIPPSVKSNCFEQILRHYLKGKTIKIKE